MKLEQIEPENSFQNRSYESINDEIHHISSKLKSINKELAIWDFRKDMLQSFYYDQFMSRSGHNSSLWAISPEWQEVRDSKPYKKSIQLHNLYAELETRLKRLKVHKREFKGNTGIIRYPRIAG